MEAIGDLGPQDPETDKYSPLLILPLLETTFDRPNEIYAQKGIEKLQREIALFKDKVGYDNLLAQTQEEMEREPECERRFIIACANSINKID